MLLATLLVFDQDTLETECLTESSNIQITWRTNEVRIEGPEGPQVLNFIDFRHTEWTSLIGLSYCNLKFIFSKLRPVGLRIYLNESIIHQCMQDSALCNQNFFNFEWALACCLKWPMVIEGPKKKRAPDWCTKQMDIKWTVPITETVFYNFEDHHFCTATSGLETKQDLKVSVRPIALVSSATNHWRESLLDATKKFGEHTLIVTETPELWPEAFEVPATGFVLANTKSLKLIRPQTIRDSEAHSSKLFGMIKNLSKTIYGTRSHEQTVRFLKSGLCQKLESLELPFDLHTYSCVIIDNCETFFREGLKLDVEANKWIHVVYDKTTTKPKAISKSLYLKLIQADTETMTLTEKLIFLAKVSAFLPQSDFTHVFGVPKHILRRYRVFGHLIRNGPIEDKILKLFPLGSPLGLEDTMQRFSGKPVPGHVACELLTRHFSRLTSSLGEYTLQTSDAGVTVAPAYVQESLSSPKSCCICFDALSDTFRFAVCGHVYCSECSTNHFKSTWSLNKVKECAVCRIALLQADVLAIEPCEIVSVLGSKAQSIKTFVGSLRSKYAQWRADTTTMDSDTKTLIIDKLANFKPCDLLAFEGPLNVHVFYTPDELSLFQTLQYNYS